MRIVHLCLYGPVMDGWNYQDNMLSKYHKVLGHEVTIVASKWVWNKDNKLEKYDKSDYVNSDGVRVIRLDIKGKKTVLSKFKRYINLEQVLNELHPDVLFIHNAAYLDIVKVVKYLKNHRSVKVFVDNHNDFSNSATNWISKNLLHKCLWRVMYKKLNPYTKKFYGVLPARVDFLTNIYKTPASKTELLVMGADDEKVIEANSDNNKQKIRHKWDIGENDILIVTGGKIDQFKAQTLLLMQAVKNINKPGIKLIVFGSVSPELRSQVNRLSDGKQVQFIGWIDANQSYEYFAAADLVVFPGRHSVFWEEVAGIGKPMICKYWDGTTHIDNGGNVKFLYQDSVAEIQEAINETINPENYQKMSSIAIENAKKFCYKDIALRCIK